MATRYPQTILVSCEIPWNEKYQLMEEAFREQIRTTLDHGFNHLYIFGTAGEGYAVTTSQFQHIVRVFNEETSQDGVCPMVGVIAMSTPQVVERISFAHDTGFRTFQICLPPWGEVDDSEVIRFFTEVCGNFPDAKFIHYNLPRTKRVLLGPDYQRLVELVPNLTGTKSCRTDIHEIVSIATQSPELQHFYNEHGFPIGCLFGECSLLSSFGALCPSKTKEFFGYGVARQWDKLFPMQAEFIRLINAFVKPTHAHPRIDGAYDKMIVRASGIEMPLRLLPPYEGFSDDIYEACVRAVREGYPNWLG